MARQHDFAGVYDLDGRELTHGHVQEHLHKLLGPDLIHLTSHHAALAASANGVTGIPDHPIHAEMKRAADDLATASHGRLSGLWHVAKFDAPIEWYAAKIVGGDPDAINFSALPVSVQVAADAMLKRDKRPTTSEFADTFENLFLTVGITAMWQQAIGTSISANTGASPAQTYAYYNNAQARIAVGDSSTAAAAGQTWLQAGTNKFAVAMDATYPLQSTNTVTFRATFTSGNANYSWQEFVVDNGNGSNSTTTTLSGGSALDRVVSNQGTKASGQTWQPSMVLTVS